MAPGVLSSLSAVRPPVLQILRISRGGALPFTRHHGYVAVRAENHALNGDPISLHKAPQRRTFTSTVSLRKKKNNSAKGDRDSPNTASKSKAQAAPTDPNDFSIFNDAYATLTQSLKDGLSKLNVGGRLNPETVENVKVELGNRDKKEAVKLGDLAQVIPRGRTLSIVAGEHEHLKPIASALLGSSLSLNAQPDPHNPMQLNAPLPPPTAEARQQAVKAATQLSETALSAVRQARQDQRKILQDMDKGKTALIDDIKKAEKKLENEVQKANDEVKRVVSDIKKKIERD